MKFNRIFLTGFRTTGKSSIGKLLADNLGLSFFDMDFLIKEQTGMEFDELTKKGTDWYKFRKIEHEVLEELLKAKNAIISCGGGVGVNDVIDPKTKKTFGQLNKEALKKSQDSLVILLTSRDEVIEKRLNIEFRKKKIMPLIGETKKISSLKDQVKDSMSALQKRKKLYQDVADFEIDTSEFELPVKLANLNCVIGDPVSQSLSPKMHNLAYKTLEVNKTNLFIPIRVKKERLQRFIEAIKVLGIKGVSVTIPHKESIMKYLDRIDETAKQIGAINTVVNDNGVLTGYNTDWVGAIVALEKKTDLKGKKVAVLGAGGAAKAIVFGLIKKGAKVKIFNRSIDKAKDLAKRFSCGYGSLSQLDETKNMDIIINSTSVGMNEDKSPLNKDLLNKSQVVFDIVYSPKMTKFLKKAEKKGAKIVQGTEMLLYQAVEQFKLYTGLDAPVNEMRRALDD